MTTSWMAVISDVHGNTWALDAVLEDVRRRGIEDVVNLGDSAYGSLDPAGAVDRLRNAGVSSISGNQDRVIFERSEEGRGSADHRFAMGRLRKQHLGWLEGLPALHVAAGVLFCHGTPRSDETYLLEKVTRWGVFLNDDDAILEHLRDTEEEVVCCGHSHVPRIARLSDGRLVVNPGSVGLPAYADDSPYPHAMETGSPHARYAVLSRQSGGWTVEHVSVPYPWRVAATVARRNGREDRARCIETGRAR
jgi:predicted phosphodiesterase